MLVRRHCIAHLTGWKAASILLSCVPGGGAFFPLSVKQDLAGPQLQHSRMIPSPHSRSLWKRIFETSSSPFHVSIGPLYDVLVIEIVMSSRWAYCSSCFIPCSCLWVIVVLVPVVWCGSVRTLQYPIYLFVRVRVRPFVTSPRRRTVRVGTSSSNVLVWYRCPYTVMHRSM